MADVAISTAEAYHGKGAPNLHEKPKSWAAWIFFGVLLVGLGYGMKGLLDDINAVNEPIAFGVFILLGLALLIALGFEFVNGFHDTANAVATVIYTHSMHPMAAVIWSGCWNLLGVLTSTGAVAFSVVTLLPVDARRAAAEPAAARPGDIRAALAAELKTLLKVADRDASPARATAAVSE